jgi:hypothetical protein
MYGLRDGETLTDEIGEVVCKQGRVVVFPNVLQHCAEPFQLRNKDKPGIRTICALFLVDPNRRILSTSDVPPQQREWHDAASRLASLFSSDVWGVLDSKRSFPLSLQQAKEARTKLMRERTYLQRPSGWFEERRFSFCEH